MQNNFLGALVSEAMRGGNPMQMIERMAGNDPRIAQARQMLAGKNPQQMQSIVEAMARQRGMTVEQIARGLGLIR